MGKLFFLLLLLVLGGVGYYLWTTMEAAPPEATLPGYANALRNDEHRAQVAASGMNTENVQAAVEKYKNMKGSLPGSLQIWSRIISTTFPEASNTIPPPARFHPPNNRKFKN